MNKSFRIVLVVVAEVVLSALVFGAGWFIGRSTIGYNTSSPFDMMGRSFANQGYSMMGNSQGMMGSYNTAPGLCLRNYDGNL